VPEGDTVVVGTRLAVLAGAAVTSAPAAPPHRNPPGALSRARPRPARPTRASPCQAGPAGGAVPPEPPPVPSRAGPDPSRNRRSPRRRPLAPHPRPSCADSWPKVSTPPRSGTGRVGLTRRTCSTPPPGRRRVSPLPLPRAVPAPASRSPAEPALPPRRQGARAAPPRQRSRRPLRLRRPAAPRDEIVPSATCAGAPPSTWCVLAMARVYTSVEVDFSGSSACGQHRQAWKEAEVSAHVPPVRAARVLRRRGRFPA
jgi:hypothetical protein